MMLLLLLLVVLVSRWYINQGFTWRSTMGANFKKKLCACRIQWFRGRGRPLQKGVLYQGIRRNPFTIITLAPQAPVLHECFYHKLNAVTADLVVRMGDIIWTSKVVIFIWHMPFWMQTLSERMIAMSIVVLTQSRQHIMGAVDEKLGNVLQSLDWFKSKHSTHRDNNDDWIVSLPNTCFLTFHFLLFFWRQQDILQNLCWSCYKKTSRLRFFMSKMSPFTKRRNKLSFQWLEIEIVLNPNLGWDSSDHCITPFNSCGWLQSLNGQKCARMSIGGTLLKTWKWQCSFTIMMLNIIVCWQCCKQIQQHVAVSDLQMWNRSVSSLVASPALKSDRRKMSMIFVHQKCKQHQCERLLWHLWMDDFCLPSTSY